MWFLRATDISHAEKCIIFKYKTANVYVSEIYSRQEKIEILFCPNGDGILMILKFYNVLIYGRTNKINILLYVLENFNPLL